MAVYNVALNNTVLNLDSICENRTLFVNFGNYS